ncbi:IMP dehydrogenase [Angomonas deanei]|nr:IMP dehydrogenase [Angomonas deanei]|eukprot:EPY30023.1 IMP dehydrogenase [Angomonas deanei]
MPRHPLRHLHRLVLGEVPLARLLPLCHGLERAHPSVHLQAQAVLEEELTRGLRGAAEHTAQHGHVGANREGLADIPDGAQSTVGGGGDPPRGAVLGDLVDRRPLRPTTGEHLLCNADTATAHPDANTVRPGVNQVLGLVLRDDVTGEYLDMREGLLHPLDEGDLVERVALGAIQHQHVHPSPHEGLHPALVVVPGASGGGTHEAAGLVQGTVRELTRPDSITAGDEVDHLIGVVENREVPVTAAVQHVHGLRQLNGGALHRHVRPLRHDIPHRAVLILNVVDILGAHNPVQLAVGVATLRHENTTDPFCFFNVHNFVNGGIGGNRLGARNKPISERLDRLHHLHLTLHGTVVVEDTNAAHEGHRLRHFILGNGIHRAADDRNVEPYLLGELTGDIHVRGGEVNEAGEDDEVIVGEAVLLEEVVGVLAVADGLVT